MEIKYTIKIKDSHNAPEFKEGMGKGVIATQIVDFKTDQDLNSPMVQSSIFSFADKMLHDWFEVVPEIVKNEE